MTEPSNHEEKKYSPFVKLSSTIMTVIVLGGVGLLTIIGIGKLALWLVKL